LPTFIAFQYEINRGIITIQVCMWAQQFLVSSYFFGHFWS